MLRRSESSHFVPDVYVFPGGTVDPPDMTEQAFARARGIGTRRPSHPISRRARPRVSRTLRLSGSERSGGIADRRTA